MMTKINKMFINIEGNKLIAEFMGEIRTYPNSTQSYIIWVSPNGTRDLTSVPFNNKDFATIKYNSSWDWLMPVVEKIEYGGYEVSIINNECEISNTGYRVASFISIVGETKIDVVYKAVVEFIKKYNDKTLPI